MDIAVLDLTHGGTLIAQCLAETDTVTAVDVYHTLDDRAGHDLKSSGISLLTEPPDADDFDLIVSPVHLDQAYPTLCGARAAGIPVITHHAAVHEILNQRLQRYEIIEVTGTTAKTSTVQILAGILSTCTDKKIISHTSAGVDYWEGGISRTIARFSIAPASIIGVVRSVRTEPDPDIFIFEVSLGGTGLADTGIITTLSGDYLIANNTRAASDAKMQMIHCAKPGSTLILGSDIISDSNAITFGNDGDVYFESIDPEHATIAAMGEQIEFTVNDYDIFSYGIAILGAVTAAISMNIDVGCIKSFLDNFSGVSGRMRIFKINGRTIIDNSNSGMNIPSAESAIDHARRIADKGKIVAIIGIEKYNVCEGLDPDGVSELIRRNRDFIDRFITVGMTGDHNVSDLDTGMDLAMNLTEEGDMIISCVKCFR